MCAVSCVHLRGSKTVVMDVNYFLRVSPGSSTDQLRDNLGNRRACLQSEARFSGQNGDRASGL
jgi:hypothetical protein